MRGVAGDVEDKLADAFADAIVKAVRPGGLAKSDASALRKSARQAAREVIGEKVTPALVKLASLTERVEWLEERRARDAARWGGEGG